MPEMTSPVIVGNIEQRPVDQLSAYTDNARTHSESQIAQIAASIVEFGFVNPILIGPDNRIIAGHARLSAARKLGLNAVPVIVLGHLSETQRRALVIADNQLALNAGWNEDILRLELAALADQDFQIELLGFDHAELKRLLAVQDIAARPLDPNIVPAAPQAPVTAPGDLWKLGEHRLLCGDTTRQGDFETVLAGARAQLVFTDLPYNAAYESKASPTLPAESASLGEEFRRFLRQTCGNLLAVCDGPLYICMSSSELPTLFQAFTEAGGQWSTFLIWAHHPSAIGQSDYRSQYVPILYGWRRGADHYWCKRDQGDLWSIPQPMANRKHPPVQPVELVERALQNSSRRGDIVLDGFAGVGTTLIACERQKRQARLIEIDPVNVDVICQRWLQFCGRPAVLDGDGRTFQQVAEERQQKAA